MRHLSSIAMLLVLLLALSCSSRPGGVPSRGKMERLLYDYHRAQAIGDVMSKDSRFNEECLLNVLDRYGMTSEMCDSAMIWYSGHPDELNKIYENLEKRLKAESEALLAQVGSSSMASIYEGGDTTNLWAGSPLLVLRPQPLQNLEHFRITADSSYHKNDHFILNADIKFVCQDRNADKALYMCLAISTNNGKVYSQVIQPSTNNVQRIDLFQSSEAEISEVSGYFFFQSDEQSVRNKSLCIISGISLIRMHIAEVADSVSSDSTSVDSIVVDSQPSGVSDSPDIPTIEISDSVPEMSVSPKTGERKQEVEDIEIRHAPSTGMYGPPAQHRQSVQQGRRQPSQGNGTRPANGNRPARQRLAPSPANMQKGK